MWFARDVSAQPFPLWHVHWLDHRKDPALADDAAEAEPLPAIAIGSLGGFKSAGGQP
jgi:hypothetical protein